MSDKQKLNLLFLCTGNACRSQMAEGFTRALRGESIEVYSAGIRAHGLDARAVQVMAEVGIDISGHSSKTVAELSDVRFDYVVTVCASAHDHCPSFAGDAQVVHKGFDDPPALAEDEKNDEAALAHYRRVRDEIKTFVLTLPAALVARDSGYSSSGSTVENNPP